MERASKHWGRNRARCPWQSPGTKRRLQTYIGGRQSRKGHRLLVGRAAEGLVASTRRCMFARNTCPQRAGNRIVLRLKLPHYTLVGSCNDEEGYTSIFSSAFTWHASPSQGHEPRTQSTACGSPASHGNRKRPIARVGVLR